MLVVWLPLKKTKPILSHDHVTYLHYISVINSHVSFLESS